MHVDVPALSAEVVHHRKVRSSMVNTWKLKRIAIKQSARPSMRKVAAQLNSRTAAAHAGALAAGVSQTPFDVFAEDMVMFPSSMATNTKLRCYLLASVPAETIQNVTQAAVRMVPEDVAAKVAANRILFPSHEVLVAAIRTLVLTEAPFEELNLFRQQCFNSFAMQHRKSLTLTKVLQLYVCAYMRKDLWRECWKEVSGIISHQIGRDVERFVSENRLNVESLTLALANTKSY